MKSSSETLVIGFDLGGTKMAAGLVDRRLQLIDSDEAATPLTSQETLLDGMVSLVEELRSRAPTSIAAIGFGIPSLIDQARGRAVISVNVPLNNFDFVSYMSGRLGLPVFIDNDANVAALAEVRAGAAAGASEMVMITLGTGIGGGIIAGGSIYRGASGSAAELGHMIIDVNGPKCPGACESFGCFEAMASGTALKRYAAEAAAARPDSELARAAAEGADLDGALLFSLAQKGDRVAQGVFYELGFYVGIGMTSLVNIFNPEYFIIGGGLMRAGGFILEPAKKVLGERGLKPNRDIVKVAAAHFGPEAGVIGAASLALSEMRLQRKVD